VRDGTAREEDVDEDEAAGVDGAMDSAVVTKEKYYLQRECYDRCVLDTNRSVRRRRERETKRRGDASAVYMPNCPE